MLYLVAFFLPPLAVFLSGDLTAKIFSCLTYLLAWFFLVSFVLAGLSPFIYLVVLIHSLVIVHRYYEAQRAAELMAVARLTAKTVADAVNPSAPTPKPAPVMPKNYDASRDVWIME